MGIIIRTAVGVWGIQLVGAGLKSTCDEEEEVQVVCFRLSSIHVIVEEVISELFRTSLFP